MRLVFLGPPGVGKGTQAEGLARELQIPHISTGAILRDALGRGTATGLAAKKLMDAGDLVPDAVVVDLVEDRFAEQDAASGWLLDGYPRNLDQGAALDGLLSSLNLTLDHVVFFECDSAELVRRLGGRRVCRKCGSTFHIEFAPPPQSGDCSEGGECEIHQRSDDAEDAILKRLDVYHSETGPLVDHFRSQGRLVVVDGSQSIDQVGVQLRAALERSS
ncbi:MAG: adenylate kinase [Planctomycetota bacterium]|nr:adenylate kinase [Planctomycetota bacterium]